MGAANQDEQLESAASPQPAPGPPPILSPRQRTVRLLGVVSIGLALVGFLRGISQPQKVTRHAPPHPHRVGHAFNVPGTMESHPSSAAIVPPAARYDELPASLSPNANWKSRMSDLRFDRPGLFEPVARTEAMKLAALADRARTRAFDGAPPVVPHPVDQQTSANCLACHGSGVKIGDRIATKVSHAHFSNCTQCHVESQAGVRDAGDTAAANSFVGVYRAGPGTRALVGSPPTIPHTTWLRDDCSSCHGLVARPGIRTTHPWLSNCTQCHAPSAALDQLSFAGEENVAKPAATAPRPATTPQ